MNKISLLFFFICRPPGNCLTDEALIYDTDEFNKVTSNAVGQVYTPNEQCRQRAGKNSFYGWVRMLHLPIEISKTKTSL